MWSSSWKRMERKMKIDVYSDGSATTADKPGGYGWVIICNGTKRSEGSGQIPNATNNDAELESSIMGLAAALKFVIDNKIDDPEVTLVSDSQIILGWANGKNRFKQKHKMAKYNALKHLVKRLDAKTRWVEGHSGDEHNTRCDKLANWARKGIPEPKLQTKKKKQVVNVALGIAIKDDLLYNMCEEAQKHANSGPNKHGTNYWMTMFVDKLKEQMDHSEYFTVVVR